MLGASEIKNNDASGKLFWVACGKYEKKISDDLFWVFERQCQFVGEPTMVSPMHNELTCSCSRRNGRVVASCGASKRVARVRCVRICYFSWNALAFNAHCCGFCSTNKQHSGASFLTAQLPDRLIRWAAARTFLGP